jgi:hypothetical protein
VSRFEIEVAKGNANYQANNFIKIGEVAGRQNVPQPQLYNFTDIEQGKAGVRYYRLKIIYQDGSFNYSIIKPIVFTSEFQTQIYPNPSDGIFNFLFQQNEGDVMSIKIYNMQGQLVQQLQTIATGFIQKINIDMKQRGIATGVYMLISEGGSTKTFKVIKDK